MESTTNQPDWRQQAACRGLDTNLFVPDEYTSHWEIQHAKAVCQRCEVKQLCLTFAVENDEVGVWGGTTGRDRREMRSRAYREGRRII